MDEIRLAEYADCAVVAMAVAEAYKVKGGPSHGPPESLAQSSQRQGWAPRSIRRRPRPKAEQKCRQRSFSCCAPQLNV